MFRSSFQAVMTVPEPIRNGWVMNFIYLFIFNLFIVNKFVSITKRIAFHKQQDLSQTPGAVNKIAECWYR